MTKGYVIIGKDGNKSRDSVNSPYVIDSNRCGILSGLSEYHVYIKKEYAENVKNLLIEKQPGNDYIVKEIELPSTYQE